MIQAIISATNLENRISLCSWLQQQNDRANMESWNGRSVGHGTHGFWPLIYIIFHCYLKHRIRCLSCDIWSLLVYDTFSGMHRCLRSSKCTDDLNIDVSTVFFYFQFKVNQSCVCNFKCYAGIILGCIFKICVGDHHSFVDDARVPYVNKQLNFLIWAYCDFSLRKRYNYVGKLTSSLTYM